MHIIFKSFIEEERKRFEIEQNNIFALSLYKVHRNYIFLEKILERYHKSIDLWNTNSQEHENYKKKSPKNIQSDMITFPSGAKQNTTLLVMFYENLEIGESVQLEIESFYLFAKILLDTVAHAIEYYFGQGRGASMDSHDNLVKHIHAYAQQKDVSVPDDFVELIKKLKQDVADFRDYQISHEKSPRTTKMTYLDEEGFLKMSVNSFGKGKGKQSEDLETMLKTIDGYLTRIVELLSANRERTILKIKRRNHATGAA